MCISRTALHSKWFAFFPIWFKFSSKLAKLERLSWHECASLRTFVPALLYIHSPHMEHKHEHVFGSCTSASMSCISRFHIWLCKIEPERVTCNFGHFKYCICASICIHAQNTRITVDRWAFVKLLVSSAFVIVLFSNVAFFVQLQRCDGRLRRHCVTGTVEEGHAIHFKWSPGSERREEERCGEWKGSGDEGGSLEALDRSSMNANGFRSSNS